MGDLSEGGGGGGGGGGRLRLFGDITLCKLFLLNGSSMYTVTVYSGKGKKFIGFSNWLFERWVEPIIIYVSVTLVPCESRQDWGRPAAWLLV